MSCHGLNAVSGLMIPDLRGSARLWDEADWHRVVMQGSLGNNGMPDMSPYIDREESEAVRAYVTQQAHRAADLEAAGQY